MVRPWAVHIDIIEEEREGDEEFHHHKQETRARTRSTTKLNAKQPVAGSSRVEEAASPNEERHEKDMRNARVHRPFRLETNKNEHVLSRIERSLSREGTGARRRDHY